MGTPPSRAPGARRVDPVYAGLAVILVGQLLRGPSRAGAVAVGLAVLFAGWAALTPGRDGRPREASTRQASIRAPE